MTPSENATPPNPPKNEGSIGWAMGVNAILMLLAYAITAWKVGSDNEETAAMYVFVPVGLVVLNMLTAIVAALMGKSETAKGAFFSILLISLIGMGLCGYNIRHMQ